MKYKKSSSKPGSIAPPEGVRLVIYPGLHSRTGSIDLPNNIGREALNFA